MFVVWRNCMRTKYIVADRVRYYRKRKCLTEEDLAKMIGKKKDFIINLEAKLFKNAPPIYILENIANALDIKIQDLMHDD